MVPKFLIELRARTDYSALRASPLRGRPKGRSSPLRGVVEPACLSSAVRRPSLDQSQTNDF
jgi:hypothetical protein